MINVCALHTYWNSDTSLFLSQLNTSNCGLDLVTMTFNEKKVADDYQNTIGIKKQSS